MAAALPAKRTAARAALADARRGHVFRQNLCPGDHRQQQVLSLDRRIAEDRQDVQNDRRQQRVPDDRVRGFDRVGDPSRDNLGQRSDIGDIVGDVKSGERLGEKQREQK